MNWKKGDLFVVAAVLVAALALFAIRALPAAAENRELRVELNGSTIEKITLKENDVQTLTIPLDKRGEAVVEIENGRVRMLPMSKELCPQAICSHVGWIEHAGEAIVCLPNRLVLTVVGGAAEDVLDGVAR
ncbi:MAG TPA: NusG domain II-containing protein [Oscillospiraceae bacterium]|nr:NusG domain II-containing protein [Oscillospiraceae bacterium]